MADECVTIVNPRDPQVDGDAALANILTIDPAAPLTPRSQGASVTVAHTVALRLMTLALCLPAACADTDDRAVPAASARGGGAGETASETVGQRGAGGGEAAGGAVAAGAAGAAQAGMGGRGGGSAGSASPQGGAGGVVPLVEVSGVVYSNEDGTPLDGALLRVIAGAPTASATTETDGRYSFELPVGATAYLSAERQGFAPLVRGIAIPGNGVGRDFYLPAQATLDSFSAAAMTAPDPAHGNVWVSFENATVAGYSSYLTASHDPPLTLDPNSHAPVIAGATLAGGLDFSFLFYPNISAGSTTVDIVSPAGHGCTLRDALDRWRVFAGATTYVDVFCD